MTGLRLHVHLPRAGAPLLLAACLAIPILASACRRADRATAAEEPLTTELASGRIRIAATVQPPAVRLDGDTLLTLAIQSPEGVAVTPPSRADLADRLEGFVLAGFYESSADTDAAATAAGRQTATEVHARLTPVPAARYRLAPMALAWADASGRQPARGWVQTASLVIPSEPLPATAGAARNDIAPLIRILPSFREILPWLLAAAGLAALAAAAWFLARRLRRAIRLRRMSPRERALLELSDLVARGLIAAGEVKAFYFELTMIVRRYIERRHAIRAPEQTTEEFLAAARRNPRFNPAVLERLRAFLEAADLVKYAARRPDPADVDRALDTARTYISADDAEAAPEES